jgi:hypothetical protein
MLSDIGYNLKISKFTQLGNSLVQLSNAVNIGIHTKSKVTMPSIGTSTETLDFLSGVPDFDFRTSDSCGIDLESKFYFPNECFGYDLTNKERLRILKDFVFPHLPIVDSDGITEDTLVIHIRSGDIFEGWIHQNYVQPPLSYYKKIIEETKPSNILIVTQSDRKNPCIDSLLPLYPNTKIQCGTLQQDVSAILNARKLVIGFGTFGWMLSMISDRIHTLHCPTICTDLLSSFYSTPPFEINRYIYKDYIKIGDWKNTKEQRELMLIHPEEKVGENYEQ